MKLFDELTNKNFEMFAAHHYDNPECINEIFNEKEYRNCPWIGTGSIQNSACQQCGAILMPKNKYGYAKTRPGLFDSVTMDVVLTQSSDLDEMRKNPNKIDFIKIGKNFMDDLARIKDFALPYISPNEYHDIGEIVYKYEDIKKPMNNINRNFLFKNI